MLLEISLRARINLLEKSISLFTFCKGKSFSLCVCSLAATACALYSAAMSNSRAEQTPLQPKKKNPANYEEDERGKGGENKK